MRRSLIAVSLSAAVCLSLSLSAEGAEAPVIVSWSNSKTGDLKTVFHVKPGEKITFSIKAEGAETYQWRVDGETVPEAKGASFKWTAPGKKGMWKILAKTTNTARQEWVKQQAAFWEKWLGASERGKTLPQQEAKFLSDMIDLRVYPTKARKEWIVSTSLINVKPGQSIQKAIDSLRPEGGIVELAPGTHEVNDTLYPPGTFQYDEKHGASRYSIAIKRSNVTIYGDRKAVVRHHAKNAHCFFLPDLERTDPNLYVENITFRGFTTSSTYTRKDRSRSAIITALHVRNLTVEEMHDTSWAKTWMRAGGRTWRNQRYNENVYCRNNLMEHCSIGFIQTRNIHVIDNRILGARQCYALGTDMRLTNLFVIGNRVINAGANSGTQLDSPRNALYCDNYVKGSQASLRLNHGGTNTLIENNTFTGSTMFGVRITSQFKSRNVLIRNNLICNGRKDGILTLEPYSRAFATSLITITNNIIYNCGRDGIRTTAEHRVLDVSNNVIANCKGYGINHTKGKITLSHNNIWNCAQGNYSGCTAGKGDFSGDPLFADPAGGDFHLKSKVGRWDQKERKWIKDNAHGPCIDAGDPKADCSREPAPNGGRINVGAYGNTSEASKSAVRPG